MILNNFYYNKKIFITGHTGSKGTWLSIWLKILGARVYGFSLNYPSSPCMFNLTDIHKSMGSNFGDIRNFQKLKKAMDFFKPEIVFHMAAQPLVRQSYVSPLETYSTNVMGTANLLETVRLTTGVKAVINVSSDKCYENKEWLWRYRENDPMGGYDPYSSSKGCAELVTSAYRRSFFNPSDYSKHGTASASVRAGNVIGGGDFAKGRLIPDVVKALMNNQTVKIRSPHAVRPWQHVLEPLYGYIVLAKYLYEKGYEFSGGWNFGPGNDSVQQVGEIVTTIVKIWGKNSKYSIEENNEFHEAQLLKLDCSKANQLIAWHTALTIEQALQWTVDWYKFFNEKDYSLQKLTEKQISKYMDIIQK